MDSVIVMELGRTDDHHLGNLISNVDWLVGNGHYFVNFLENMSVDLVLRQVLRIDATFV